MTDRRLSRKLQKIAFKYPVASLIVIYILLIFLCAVFVGGCADFPRPDVNIYSPNWESGKAYGANLKDKNQVVPPIDVKELKICVTAEGWLKINDYVNYIKEEGKKRCQP